MRSSPPPRAAYIHIPFCARRCGYCNFALIANRQDLIAPYLEAIDLELSQLGTSHKVETLYFGGGTPTQLAVSEFHDLAISVLHWLPLAKGYEWTVEANPADLDQDYLRKLAELGVSRLSIGGQSFNNQKLIALERDHQAADLGKAIALAKETGLQVAVDLIFAAPGETLADWEADLDALLTLAPHHISTYGLTFEKGTSFGTRLQQGALQSAPEEIERAMYELAIQKLTEAGYEHYEISNFALPGFRSRHNQVYWAGQEYFAAGPGAARYVHGVRETNHRSTTTYLKRMLNGESPVADRDQLSREDRARERFIFGLRQLAGVEIERFETEVSFAVKDLFGPALEKHCECGLLENTGQRIRLTHEGLLVSDAIWPDLL